MTTLGRGLEWSVALAGLALAVFIVREAHDPAAVVAIVTLSVGALIAWIIVQDVTAFTISDSAVLSVALLAFAYRWSASTLSGGSALGTCLAMGADALLPGGILLLFREVYFRRKGFDGLGLGDVKLAAVGGLLVGAVGFSWALLGASLLALGFVGLSHLVSIEKPLGRSDKLAFGAILAPALWAVWVAEQLPTLLLYTDP